jgi:hypothetical protein
MRREQHGWPRETLGLLTAVLCAALALVAPATGPSRPGAHDFTLVHPIFPHRHDPRAAHHEPAPDPADAPELRAPWVVPTLGIGPAGPFGSPAAELVNALLGRALPALTILASLSTLALTVRRLRDQAWLAVPSGPPR